MANITNQNDIGKPEILTSETVYFDNTFKDTHSAFDKDKKIYTIVRSGFYFVKKYYNAGEIIDNPEMVRSE